MSSWMLAARAAALLLEAMEGCSWLIPQSDSRRHGPRLLDGGGAY
jgi:hypothetical protein